MAILHSSGLGHTSVIQGSRQIFLWASLYKSFDEKYITDFQCDTLDIFFLFLLVNATENPGYYIKQT